MKSPFCISLQLDQFLGTNNQTGVFCENFSSFRNFSSGIEVNVQIISLNFLNIVRIEDNVANFLHTEIFTDNTTL